MVATDICTFTINRAETRLWTYGYDLSFFSVFYWSLLLSPRRGDHQYMSECRFEQYGTEQVGHFWTAPYRLHACENHNHKHWYNQTRAATTEWTTRFQVPNLGGHHTQVGKERTQHHLQWQIALDYPSRKQTCQGQCLKCRRFCQAFPTGLSGPKCRKRH